MDVWNSPVLCSERKYRYIAIYVCINSNYVVVDPLENLCATSITASLYYLINYNKIRFGKSVKLLCCDGFKTFQEQILMKNLRIRFGLKIEVFPPYLHHWNQAENVIGIVRRAGVVALRRISSLQSGSVRSGRVIICIVSDLQSHPPSTTI